MIGIIGALDEEIKLICDRIDDYQVTQKALFEFYTGKIGSMDVVAVKCGVGKVNAALCSQILIDVFHCKKILFGGVAGGLLPGLKQGDVVVSSHAVQFDLDLTAFGRRYGELADHDRLIEADPDMVVTVSDVFDEMFEEKSAAPTLIVGTIVSGDSFVSDPKTIKWLQREFSAACTEMEGGALAYTCKANKVPFVIVRVISDSGSGKAVQEFESFVSKSSDLLYRLISKSVERL